MKKLTALLLALVMLLSLAACGKNVEDETPDDQQGSEVVDDGERLPLVKDGSKPVITIGIMQKANVENYDTNDYTLWIEEKTGIDLEFVYFNSNSSDANTQFALMVNGGEKLPDIMWGMTGFNSTIGHEYGQQGYFIDLNPYFEDPDMAYYFNQELAKISADHAGKLTTLGKDPLDGAQYAFPYYALSNGFDRITNHIYINTEWLEAVGEDMPTTPDELYTVLKKFATEDPNGNGKIDEIPMVGGVQGGLARCNVLEYILNAYIYVNDNYCLNADDGVVYAPQTTDEYREGLKFLNKLYKEGLLSPTTFSLNSAGEMMALLTPADGTAIIGMGGGHNTLVVEENNDVAFQYQIMPVLDAGTGRGGYLQMNSPTFNYNTYITADCENPELAFKLLDFICCEDSMMVMRFGLEGKYWERVPEGTVNPDGSIPTYKILDDTAFSAQNNANWHVINSCFADWTRVIALEKPEDATDKTWNDKKNEWAEGLLDTLLSIPQKPEMVFTLVYGAEINTELAQVRKDINAYMEEARALFTTGAMDPYSDADWNAYLKNLETMGLSMWLENAQVAYTKQVEAGHYSSLIQE